MSTISLELVNAILAYASLPPHRLLSSLVVLGTFVTACEYARISLIVESPRSRSVHVALCLLTFAFQAIAMAAMLVYADVKYIMGAGLSTWRSSQEPTFFGILSDSRRGLFVETVRVRTWGSCRLER